MRSKIIDEPTGVLVVIPARVKWFEVLFTVAWLGGWAYGEVDVLRDVLHPEGPGGAPPLLLLWLAVWTLGGLLALASVAWMLVGEERIRVSPGELSVKHDLFGIGRTRRYEMSQVRRLRLASRHDVTSDSQRSWRGLDQNDGGAIAFDYGAGTVLFGESIDPAEAMQLIQYLSQRFPIVVGDRPG
ncbi:MAG: hypothetical protein GXP47_12815 [Acidobacteria bacterium]|nr:hypothetical protein [Acidobacteriota bacterium]